MKFISLLIYLFLALGVQIRSSSARTESKNFTLEILPEEGDMKKTDLEKNKYFRIRKQGTRKISIREKTKSIAYHMLIRYGK